MSTAAAVRGRRDDVGWLERQFDLAARGTTVATEVRAGLTTFMVMSYIIVLNAVILTTGTGIAKQELSFSALGTTVSTVPGKAVLPERWITGPDFSTLGAGLNVEAFARLGLLSAILTVVTVMLSDFFDTMGTVVAIGKEAGLLDERGRPARLERILLVDSLAAAAGGLFGASSATSYIESGAGVAEGGRTGLSSVVAAIPFLLAMFVGNVIAVVPPEATAAALIVVGFYMMAAVGRELPWSSIDEGLPALLTLTIMPLTWSITNGIGAGVIFYSFLKLIRGRAGELHPLMLVVSAAFVVYFLWGAG